MQTRRRFRAPFILIIGLVTAGGAWAGFGMGPGSADPADIFIGLPREGDEGQYWRSEAVAEDGTLRLKGAASPFVSFRWLASATAPGAGGLVPSHRVRVQFHEAAPVEIHLDASGAILAQTKFQSVTADTPQGTSRLHRTETSTVRERTTYGPPASPTELPFCGLRNLAQGRPVSAGDEILLTDRCFLPGQPRDAPALAASIAPDGRVVFADQSPRRAVLVWYEADVPYPAAIAVARTDADSKYDLYTLRLTREGTAASDVVLAPRPLPWSVAPAPRAGFAAGGLRLPFQPSAAFEAASRHPLAEDLRAFLQSHPEARTILIAHARSVDANQQERLTWWFDLSDGRSAFSFQLSRGVSTAIGMPNQPPVQDEYESAYGRVGGPFVGLGILRDDQPLPFALPKMTPTLASFHERWRTLHGDDLARRDSWSVALACVADPCREAGFAIRAGHASSEGLKPLRFDTANATDGLELDPEGAPTVRWRESSSSRTELVLPFTAPANESSAAPRSLSVPSAPDARDWRLPGLVVAGVAAVAAFVWWAATHSWFLHSRLEPEAALRHPLRAEIHSLVEANPGIHYQHLVRTLRKSHGTTGHHLRVLVRLGLIVEEATRGYTCYFVRGRVDRSLMAAAAVLKSDGARRVLDAAIGLMDANLGTLADRVGLSPRTVRYHAARLEASGLISTGVQGRELRLRPTAAATAALGRWAPPA